jgi:hypothetical protein
MPFSMALMRWLAMNCQYQGRTEVTNAPTPPDAITAGGGTCRRAVCTRCCVMSFMTNARNAGPIDVLALSFITVLSRSAATLWSFVASRHFCASGGPFDHHRE